jgi:hypothetical protein
MDLTNITGYRTNEDGTETLAYFVDERGFVTHCAHDDRNICIGCFEADSRLYRNINGSVVRVG